MDLKVDLIWQDKFTGNELGLILEFHVALVKKTWSTHKRSSKKL